MQYVDQSADLLRFYLIHGMVDVEALTVLKQTSFFWSGLRVEAGILGASHYLRIDEEGHQPLFEIFACAELKEAVSLVTSGPLANIKSNIVSKVGSLEYSFVPQRMPWREGARQLEVLLEDASSAKAEDNSFSLHFEFPSDVPNPVHKPITVLRGNYRHSRCLVRSAHCYPNEETIVFTTTVIKRSAE
jgi:hypothetical protein